jgi:hypothetical protein
VKIASFEKEQKPGPNLSLHGSGAGTLVGAPGGKLIRNIWIKPDKNREKFMPGSIVIFKNN